MRLAAGLCSDPLAELERSPRPPCHNSGRPTSKGEGREWEKGRKGGREGEGWTPVPDWESAKVADLS